MGVVGYLTVEDLDAASQEQVERTAEAFPALAITPAAVLPGPFDPGGAAVRLGARVSLVATVVGAALLLRRFGRGGGGCCAGAAAQVAAAAAGAAAK